MKKKISLMTMAFIIMMNISIPGQGINKILNSESIKNSKERIYKEMEFISNDYLKIVNDEASFEIGKDTIKIKNGSNSYISWTEEYAKDGALIRKEKTKDDTIFSFIITFGIIVLFFMIIKANQGDDILENKNSKNIYYIILTIVLSVLAYSTGIYRIKDYMILGLMVVILAIFLLMIIKEWSIPPSLTIIIFFLHLLNYRDAVIKYDKTLPISENENLTFVFNAAIFLMALVIFYFLAKSHNKNKALE